MRITAIEKQERRPRVNIFTDGVYRFSLSLAVFGESGLQVGAEVREADVIQLEAADARYVAYQAAVRLLSYRPRSEKELRRRLRQRSVAETVVDETIEKLKRQGYVDDTAFAQSWVASRNQISPRGKRLLTWELRAKGVAAETAAEAAAGTSDEDAAYRAALKRVRSLRTDDPVEFRRRLGDFLVRRGFSWDVVRTTVDRLWSEAGGDPLEDDAAAPDGI
jgi:regulatory protein